MPFVLDASIAAAWFLPDEQHDDADALMTDLRSTPAIVPSLFWPCRKHFCGSQLSRERRHFYALLTF